MPDRVQLSRAKGWRMPPNTVKVDRSTKWGNPYQVGPAGMVDRRYLVHLYRDYLWRVEQEWLVEAIRRELKGKNLACWCPAGPCHADVLLEIANG